jgi:hypothetical protein
MPPDQAEGSQKAAVISTADLLPLVCPLISGLAYGTSHSVPMAARTISQADQSTAKLQSGTTDPARLTSPVTILHNSPPTIKRPENPEIVTILHSPDSPAQVRMGIILIENASQ